MEKIILDELKNIQSYRYDQECEIFLHDGVASSGVLMRDLVAVLNILSENFIQFAVDENFYIKVNLIDIKPQDAFVVSLDKDANIIEINDVALQMSGYSKDNLIGKNYFDIFIDPENQDDIHKVFLSVLSGSNNFWRHQNNIILKNGSKQMLSWSNALIKNKNSDVSTIHAFGVPAS